MSPAIATSSRAALTNPKAQPRIPEWATKGTSDCALSIAPNVSIFCENEKVILRLNGKTKGEVVEFEVAPSALPKTFKEEVDLFAPSAQILSHVPLVESALFQRLAMEEGLKIRKLSASGEHALIEGTLAKNAVVSGDYKNCIFSLRGGPATFEKFVPTGASTLDFDLPKSTFKQTVIGKECALKGNLEGLTIQGPGSRIEAYCVGLKLRDVTRTEGAETLGTIFKGAHLSGKTVDLSLFANATKQLTQAELKECITKLNLDFANQHCGGLRLIKSVPGVGQTFAPLKVLANSGSDIVQTSSNNDSRLRIEFKMSEEEAAVVRSVVNPADSYPSPTLVVTIPMSTEHVPFVGVTCQVKDKEGNDVLADLGMFSTEDDYSLSHYALLSGILRSRGRKRDTVDSVLLTYADAVRNEVVRIADMKEEAAKKAA